MSYEFIGLILYSIYWNNTQDNIAIVQFQKIYLKSARGNKLFKFNLGGKDEIVKTSQLRFMYNYIDSLNHGWYKNTLLDQNYGSQSVNDQLIRLRNLLDIYLQLSFLICNLLEHTHRGPGPHGAHSLIIEIRIDVDVRVPIIYHYYTHTIRSMPVGSVRIDRNHTIIINI